MNILIISSYGYVKGGTESLLALLKPALIREGHEVRIITSEDSSESHQFNDEGFASFNNHNIVRHFFEKIWYPAAYMKTKKILKDFKPDVVHIHTTEQLSPSVFFALRGYPVLVSVHGPEEYLPESMLWAFPPHFFKSEERVRRNLTSLGRLHYAYHKFISKPMYGFAMRTVVRTFIVHSQYMKQFLLKERIEARVVQLAADLLDYRPLNVNSRVIAYIGRLEENKGVQFLIDALPAIINQNPDAKLIVAGEGSFKPALEHQVKRLGIQKYVSFVGRLNRKEMQNLYDGCALSVVPSIWPEPFGLVGIEAMSVGRLVVGTNTGGIPEWLDDGKTGRLVPPASAKALATAVNDLLSNPEKNYESGLVARKASEQFSIGKHVEEMTRLYKAQGAS